jgi:cyanophycinase-like exopeptidase
VLVAPDGAFEWIDAGGDMLTSKAMSGLVIEKSHGMGSMIGNIGRRFSTLGLLGWVIVDALLEKRRRMDFLIVFIWVQLAVQAGGCLR